MNDNNESGKTEPVTNTVYRVGRHLGFTLYADDNYIGTMKDPETAAWVAEKLNQLEALNL